MVYQTKSHAPTEQSEFTGISTLAIFDIVTTALSMISILGYGTFLIMRWKESSLSNRMTLTLLFPLFGALLCYLLVFIMDTEGINCIILASCTQFLFLSTLTWTNAMAINITRVVYSSYLIDKSKRLFKFYALYAFGLPLLLVIVTVTLSVADLFERPVYQRRGVCFISEPTVIYSLFLGPIYLCITSNIILCVISIIRISRSKITTSNDVDRVKRNIVACIKLSICLGAGWIILFLAYWWDPLWQVVQLFVELQGVLIVVGNIINWKCCQAISKPCRRSSMTTDFDLSTRRESTSTILSTITTASTEF